MYRRQDLTLSFSSILEGESIRPYGTWEMPILAKYRMSSWHASPYVGFGPSFRRVQGGAPQYQLADTPSQLSNTGVAAAVGFSAKMSRLQVGPELRYTRWADSRGASPALPWKRDQIEFLVGLSF